MNQRRHSYQKYKDTRECLTKKIIDRSMYILVNDKDKPIITTNGSMLIFYRRRRAYDYLFENALSESWKVKKVRLDITTL